VPRAIGLLILPLVLALAACTATAPAPEGTETVAAPSATPTPTPTATPTPAGPPALGALVLSPDGLGTLRIGEPIDPLLATYDAQGCLTPDREAQGWDPNDPALAAWIPNYAMIPIERGGHTYEYYPFEPHHNDDGTLEWLTVRSPEISTERGIHLGSLEDEVLAAYPEAERLDEGGGRVYGLSGNGSKLVIEVVTDTMGRDDQIGQVWSMRLEPLEWQLTSLANGDAGGFCALEV
jgi:hypothetical protein